MNLDAAKDDIATLVMTRLRGAKQSRENRIVFQNRGFDAMLVQADQQYKKIYNVDSAARIQATFGYCPTRYISLTNEKVNAARAWKTSLTVNALDRMVTCIPTPEPELDDFSRENIRQGIEADLRQRILQRGNGVAATLLDHQGNVEKTVKDFMVREAQKLKAVEQVRLVGVATEGAKRATMKMRDRIIEGGFRIAYNQITHNQFLYGMGIARFPSWQNVAVIEHAGKGTKRTMKMRPVFRSVDPRNFYSSNDAESLNDCTGNTELSKVTKAQLVAMAKDKRYDKKAIEQILITFDTTDRAWLSDNYNPATTMSRWSPDEHIDICIHEGFFNGQDLEKIGVKGISPLETVNAHVVICGGHTILCEADKAPKGVDRTYSIIPYQKIGTGIYDVTGISHIISDYEEQVNMLMAVFENNITWATMPPLMKNSTVFQNPADAVNIQPGQQYEVSDQYTGGAAPEPLRSMRTVSAQYHLIMSEINAIIKLADNASGIPSFAYSGASYGGGRGSLGEFSARLTAALRVIREAALMEDTALESSWHAMFNYLLENEPGFCEGMDVDLQIRGVTGLLQEDEAAKNNMAVLAMVQGGVDRGSVPKEVEEYVLRQQLESAGVPAQELGMDNILLDHATAQANGMPQQGLGAGQQIPALDGRSMKNMPQGGVASPSGAETSMR
jgi:hypothetical protein